MSRISVIRATMWQIFHFSNVTLSTSEQVNSLQGKTKTLIQLCYALTGFIFF